MKKGFTLKLKFTGFTLIEMVVSISIIAIISTLFVANYRSSNKRTDLILAAQSLVADFHAAQNNALGLNKYNGSVPPGGWGLSLTTGAASYVLFADLEAPGVSGNLEYDATTEGNINYGARVTEFPRGIIISNIKTSLASSTAAADVTFLPPDPKTNIYDVNSGATSTAIEITMQETINNTTKTIRVNFLGLAEVID